jgi:hypothetical protein
MLSFSKSAKNDSLGYDDCKVQEISPYCNTEDTLEFHISPQKRYFKPCDSRLCFFVEIPGNYVLDNDFCVKLFKGLPKIEIAEDPVTSKSSDLDSMFSSHFLTKCLFDQSTIDSTFPIQGVYDIFESDATELTPTIIAYRELYAEEFLKTIEVDGEIYTSKWRRYEFKVSLNHGLARAPIVLPSGLGIHLAFERAPAKFSLLKKVSKLEATDENGNVHEIDYEYPTAVVELVKPHFKAMYVYSEKLEREMSKYATAKFETDFLDYCIRRPTLEAGDSDYTVNLTKGSFPKYAVFAVTTLKRAQGSFENTVTKLSRDNIEQIDILVDGSSLPGFPLKTNMDFYENFLVMSERYLNPWSSGVLPFPHFLKNNFFVLVNFEMLGRENSSQLVVKIKFKQALEEKHLLIYMPLTEKRLVITPENDVSVENIDK